MIKKGLVGLALGVLSGVAAGILLSPRTRRGDSQALPPGAAFAGAVLDAAGAGLDVVQSVARLSGIGGGGGIHEDERVTLRVRDELQDFALWSPRLDVTTIDGIVYLRGKEDDTTRADAIVRVTRGIDGVHDIVDEIRRE